MLAPSDSSILGAGDPRAAPRPHWAIGSTAAMSSLAAGKTRHANLGSASGRAGTCCQRRRAVAGGAHTRELVRVHTGAGPGALLGIITVRLEDKPARHEPRRSGAGGSWLARCDIAMIAMLRSSVGEGYNGTGAAESGRRMRR